jgi:hypothetical protein
MHPIRSTRLVLYFALAGLLTTIIAGFCMTFQAPNIVTNLMILVSPGLWLFLPRVWGRMPIENSALAQWVSIGVVAIVNGFLYAMAGGAIAILRVIWTRRNSSK